MAATRAAERHSCPRHGPSPQRWPSVVTRCEEQQEGEEQGHVRRPIRTEHSSPRFAAGAACGRTGAAGGRGARGVPELRCATSREAGVRARACSRRRDDRLPPRWRLGSGEVKDLVVLELELVREVERLLRLQETTRLHHQRGRHRAAPSSLPWLRHQPWLASSSLTSTRLNIPVEIADFSRCCSQRSCTPSAAHRDGNPASANLTGSLLAVFGCPHVFHLLRCVSPRVKCFHQTGEIASVCSLEFPTGTVSPVDELFFKIR